MAEVNGQSVEFYGGINGHVSATKVSLPVGEHETGFYLGMDELHLVYSVQDTLHVNEYLTGFQSRYMAATSQVFRFAVT